MIRMSPSTFMVDMVRASSQRHADQRPEPQYGRRDAEPEAKDRARDRARPERRAGAQGAPGPGPPGDRDDGRRAEPGQIDTGAQPIRRQADERDRQGDRPETDQRQTEPLTSVVVGSGDRRDHGRIIAGRTPLVPRSEEPRSRGTQADLRPRIATRLLIFVRAW